jgi:hypothetical protein
LLDSPASAASVMPQVESCAAAIMSKPLEGVPSTALSFVVVGPPLLPSWLSSSPRQYAVRP